MTEVIVTSPWAWLGVAIFFCVIAWLVYIYRTPGVQFGEQIANKIADMASTKFANAIKPQIESAQEEILRSRREATQAITSVGNVVRKQAAAAAAAIPPEPPILRTPVPDAVYVGGGKFVLQPNPVVPEPPTVAVSPPPPTVTASAEVSATPASGDDGAKQQTNGDTIVTTERLAGGQLRNMLRISARGAVITESEHELVNQLGASAATYVRLYGRGGEYHDDLIQTLASVSDDELNKMAETYATPIDWAIKRWRNLTVPATWADLWKEIGKS